MIKRGTVSCFLNMETKSVNMICTPKSEATFCSIIDAKENNWKLSRQQQNIVSQNGCQSDLQARITRGRLNEINQLLYDHHRGLLHLTNEEMQAIMVEIEETIKADVYFSQKLRNIAIADCNYLKKIVSKTKQSIPDLNKNLTQTDDIFADAYVEPPSIPFGQLSQHSTQKLQLSNQNSDLSSNILAKADLFVYSNLDETPNIANKICSAPLPKYIEPINEKLNTLDPNLVIDSSSKSPRVEDNANVLKTCNAFDLVVPNESKIVETNPWLSKRSNNNLQKSQFAFQNALMSPLTESKRIEKAPNENLSDMKANKDESKYNKRSSTCPIEMTKVKRFLNLSPNVKPTSPQTPNILALLHNEILFIEPYSPETPSEQSFDVEPSWKNTKKILQEAKNLIRNISNSDSSDFENTIMKVSRVQNYNGCSMNSSGIMKYCLTNHNVATLADRLSVNQRFLESTIQSIIMEDTGYSSGSKISYFNEDQSTIVKHHTRTHTRSKNCTNSDKFFSNFFRF